MPDSIAVLNAGSSSLKFSLYALAGAEFELISRGQVEGLKTRPRFEAKDAAGGRGVDPPLMRAFSLSPRAEPG